MNINSLQLFQPLFRRFDQNNRFNNRSAEDESNLKINARDLYPKALRGQGKALKDSDDAAFLSRRSNFEDKKALENENVSDLFNKLAKRATNLTDKLGQNLEKGAVRDLKSFLQDLEDNAARVGVDREQFRKSVTEQFIAQGLDSNLNGSIEDSELKDKLNKQTLSGSTQSAGSFQTYASAIVSGNFNLNLNLTNKEGQQVQIGAEFEVIASAEVAVRVAREKAQQNTPQASANPSQNSDSQSDYGSIVGGLFARLKDLQAKIKDSLETKKDTDPSKTNTPNSDDNDNPTKSGAAFEYSAFQYSANLRSLEYSSYNSSATFRDRGISVYTSASSLNYQQRSTNLSLA
jgi:hypothetical protein